MRNHILITLLCCTMLGTATASAKRIVLTKDNIGQINTANSFFVIDDNINLNKQEYTVGVNSVLQFRGGSFKNGTVNINGASVDAPPYCIFDNVQVNGIFANEEVQAKWFTPSSDAGYILNRASSMAPANRINLSGTEHFINSPIYAPIRLDTPGLRLKINGRIGADGSNPPIFEMSAPDTQLYIRKFSRSQNSPTAGLLLCGDVRNSRIEFQELSITDKGLSFYPSSDKGDTQKVWNNKIRFEHIVADYPIYFNDANPEGGSATLTAKGNYLLGNRLSGDCGVWQATSLLPETYPYHANVYLGLGFERVDSVCVRMRGSDNEVYEYARMNEELPKNGKPFLDISKSKHSRIYTKGLTNAGREIKPGEDVYNVDIRAFTNTGKYYAITNITRAFVTSPSADATGPAAVYLTSYEIPYNKQARTLDYAASSIQKTDNIAVEDLFDVPGRLASNTRIFNDLCVLNIGSNRTVSLARPVGFKTTVVPLTLVVNLLAGDAKFLYGSSQVSGSGTYRLVWKPGTYDWTCTIEKIH